MAEERQTIFKIDFDTAGVAKKISDATTELTKQKDMLAKLKIETKGFTEVSEEQAAKIALTRAEIEKQNRVIKSNTALIQASTMTFDTSNQTLEEQRQTVNALQKAYAAMTKEQKDAAGGEKLLQEQIKGAVDALKEQESAIGDNRRNVGNYAESMEKALKNSGDFIKNLAQGMVDSGAVSKELASGLQSVNKVADAFTKNPILGVLQLLWTAIIGNEEAMAQLKVMLQYLGNMFKQVEPYISAFGKMLGGLVLKAISKVAEGVTWLTKQIDKLGKFFGRDWHVSEAFETMKDKVTDTTEATEELTETLDKAKNKAEELRKAALETFRTEWELNELRKESLDILEHANAEYYKALINQAKVLDEAYENETKQLDDYAEKREALLGKLFGSATQLAMQSELKALAENYAEKLLTEEEYQRARNEIIDRYNTEANTKDVDDYRSAMGEKAAAVGEWGGKAMEVLNAANGLANALQERELSKYKKTQDEKKKALENQLKKGQISQEQYEAKVQALDEETAAKEKEMAVSQAKREKALNLMTAALNTAQAILSAIAQFGPPPSPMGIAGIASAATIGAVQMSTIAAQPIPEMSHGGVVEGNYSDGDIHPAMLAGQEVVLNPMHSSKILYEIANGGMTAASNYEAMADAMMVALSAMPSPVMEYSEFKTFEGRTAQYKEITKI